MGRSHRNQQCACALINTRARGEASYCSGALVRLWHWHVGAAKLNLALVWNVRTWPAMSREKAQAAPTARPKVPMRRRGADCPVVVSKRVQCSCSEGGRSSPWGASQLATGGAPILDGRRQPSCGGTSRMTRECQVRIWCSEASCHSSG